MDPIQEIAEIVRSLKNELTSVKSDLFVITEKYAVLRSEFDEFTHKYRVDQIKKSMSEEVDSGEETEDKGTLSQSVRLPKTQGHMSFKDSIQEKLDQKFQELINGSLNKLFE